MNIDDDTPPTSPEEAARRASRPPEGSYNPESMSHWTMFMSEAAYRRGELFDKRRELMKAWAAYGGAGG
jgi:hypothetical protein